MNFNLLSKPPTCNFNMESFGLYIRLFLCGFPVGASGRNHRTIEFFSNFLEFFGKMLEFFEQKYQVFGKNFEFWWKPLAIFAKIQKTWNKTHSLHFLHSVFASNVKFSLLSNKNLEFSSQNLSFCEKGCTKPPEHWVLGLKILEFFPALEFFSPWVFAKTHKKKPGLCAN